MRHATRITIFSLLAGPFWSILPLSAASGLSEQLVVTASAVATAWITSWLLTRWLTHYPDRTVVLGMASLPLGTFTFGVVQGILGWSAAILVPGKFLNFVIGLNPVEAGIAYAFLSTCTFMAIVLMPCAIFTTYLLRELVVSRRRGNPRLLERPDFSRLSLL